MAQTVKVITRSTASNTAATNPAYGASDTSTNKGAALTSSEMDMNLLNLKDAIEGTSTRFDEAHNEDGSLKALSVDGGDLSANSVDYSKIKSVHYGVDGGSAANTLTFTAAGLAALEDGMLFLVKVSNANTGATTLEVTGSSGSLGAKSVYKNKNTPLISGDLKAGEMVGMLYDLSNTAFQLLGGGVEDSIALAALATQSSGNLISFATGGGAPVLIPAGSTGQVLTATSNNAPPSFQNIGIAPLIELTEPTADVVTPNMRNAGDSNGQIWVPPTGVTKIRVCLQGAGASGYGHYGGGGGEYTESEFTVASNQVYQIHVGTGGPPAAGGPSDYRDYWGNTTAAAGEATTFKLVTGTGGQGVLTLTVKASANGGNLGTSSSAGSASSGGTQNLKTVPGSAGGAKGVVYPGASALTGDLGGHGGVSYKGTPGFGSISSVTAPGKQSTGLGYGFGGGGGNGNYAAGDRPTRQSGGHGWAAIYDIT
jgi:hypothetical protein